MEKSSLVQATQTDIDDIFGLIRACADDLQAKGMDHWASYYDSPDRLRAKFEHGHVFIMRDEQGKAIGTVSVSGLAPEYYTDNHDGEGGSPVNYIQMFAEPASEQAIYRSALAIHPSYQGQKLGKQLIEMTEQWAREQGIKYIRFDTRNVHLLEYYARNGYRVVGEMPDGDVTYYLLEKAIN